MRRNRQFYDFSGSVQAPLGRFFTLGKIARQNFDRFGALGIFSQTLARHAKATLTPDRRIHAKQQGEADKDAINYDDEDPEPTDPSKQIPFVQFPRIRSGLWDAGRYSCNQ